MNAIKKIASMALAALLGISSLSALAESAPVQPELVARVKDIIEADGYQFKDLNDNGELDPYEDWRLPAEERAENLLSMMDAGQKAAQMVHLTLVTKKDSWFSKDNVGFALVYEYIFDVEEADEEDEEEEEEDAVQVTGSTMNAAVKTNEIQELSESSELGIPVIFSMDTEAGAAFVKDATFLPDEINLGAADNVELTAKYYQVLKEELEAIGVRMALSPDADLMTDPRWGRNQECYSEDTAVVQKLIAVAVQTLQNGSALTPDSVLACVKHFPGAGVRSTRQLVDEVEEDRLTDACRRILTAKFQMGLFENPYVDENKAETVIGSEAHKAVAKEAAAASFTLVKYENAASLEGKQFIVAGSLANDVRCLNSGWTAKEPVEIQGTTILEALKAKAGTENVTYIETAADVPADLSGVTAVVVIGEKSGTHDPAWGASTLEFPEDQAALINALDQAGANVVAVVVMNRAYVLSPIAEAADSVLLVYRPGVTCGAEAVADCLFGETAITGKLPFQIPASMDQVLAQREDMPKDIENPLYEYGFGIDAEGFGR